MRAMAVTVLVMFAVAACGSDTPGTAGPARQQESGDPAARDVIAASLRAPGDDDPNALQLSAEEADCAADAIAAEIGIDRLEEIGLDVEQQAAPRFSQPPLTTEEGDVVYGAYEECIDLVGQVTALVAADGSFDDEGAQCVAEEYLASGLLRESLLAPGFNQDLNERVDAALVEAFRTCST